MLEVRWELTTNLICSIAQVGFSFARVQILQKCICLHAHHQVLRNVELLVLKPFERRTYLRGVSEYALPIPLVLSHGCPTFLGPELFGPPELALWLLFLRLLQYVFGFSTQCSRFGHLLKHRFEVQLSSIGRKARW